MGQRIDWSGVDGGWYSLVKDDHADLHVNVRVTAPLPEEFPDRQLITAVSILSRGHSLAIEVKNPYAIDTDGCHQGVSPCLSNGGLRVIVDGEEVDTLAGFSRDRFVADSFEVSAANLPAECRQFGGDRVWAETYDTMIRHNRKLVEAESFEEWILRFQSMAAPDWCAKYISENEVAGVQSIHSVFRIATASNVVRLNVGTNYQKAGDVDGAGRVLPDLEFWQMDVGIQGLSLDEASLSGLLGETARPVLDEDGREIMDGYDAFRGTVEDYRVSGPLGSEFALLTNKV